MEISEDSLSLANLNGYIKQNRNADFRSLVSNVNMPHLISIGGKTLIHTAATSNNIEIIAYLYITGFDINAQNTFGQTALHLAIQNKNFQAVQLLLSLDADILIDDNSRISILDLCFLRKIKVPEYIISSCLQRLKRTGLTSQQLADHLLKVNCSVYEVLTMNDADITGMMLDKETSINKSHSRALLERAIDFDYPENVKMLVKRGPGLDERLEMFINEVTHRKFDLEMTFYFKQIINWDIVTTNFLSKASQTFERCCEKDILMYLEIGMDEYARREHDVELLVGLFANNHIDVVKILKNRRFNVNGLDMENESALHVAASSKNKVGIIYLLDCGADPNIKNDQGETPLFGCYDNECIELLLQAGADPQIVNNAGRTIIENFPSRGTLAYLCILDAKNLLNSTSKIAIKNIINKYPLKSIYDSDLEWMKTCHVSKSATLFTVVSHEIYQTARFVKTKADAVAIFEASYARKLQPTYVSILTNNLKKARKWHKLRTRAAGFLSSVMKIDQYDHLVIDKIVGFLTYRDLLVLDKIDFG